jgi:drug/metabolite transporter (DMT)-like permease
VNRHRPSGRSKLGLGLVLITTYSWGVLPVILKALLENLDAYTLTWYRFGTAASILCFYVGFRYGFRVFFSLRRSGVLLGIVCVFGATSNYVTYLLGLEHMSPGGAQAVIQLAPVLTLLGGLVLFRESFSGRQWVGFVILLIGIGLFFNMRYDDLFVGSNLVVGIFWVAVSALAAACYALAQKQLLQILTPESILLLLYLFGWLMLSPFAQPGQGLLLTRTQLVLLVLSAVITLFSNFCYASAMKHIEISRISLVLALNPLMTVGNMALVAVFLPGFVAPESLNVLSLTGAGLVVFGSMLGVGGSTRTTGSSHSMASN